MVCISRTLPLGSTPETVFVCSKGILNISSIVFAAAMAKCIAEEKWSKIRCKNCPVQLIRKLSFNSKKYIPFVLLSGIMLYRCEA